MNVEQVSETEKLERRRYQEARAAAIRRGTWIVGAWACFLGATAATWYLEGSDRGLIAAVFVLGGALFTGLCGLGYAAKIGFALSLAASSKADEMRWTTVLWVTLWGTLLGGALGLALILFIVRDVVVVFLSSGAAFALGAAIGNRLAHRKYPRLAAK